jgi:hypothetical protein
VPSRAKGVPGRFASVRPAKASSEGWRLCLRPNSGCFGVVQRGAPDIVRCAIFQHTQVLAPVFYRVPDLMSLLVCVEPYAPVIHEF